MKKSLYSYLGLPAPKQVDLDSIKQFEVESSDSSKAILKAIYALDPVTKLPTGDIMCYMSSATPPEVKQYIIDNIMVDTSSKRLPSLPEGLDDDTAFALERRVGESADSYRTRISNYMQEQVRVRDMAIENEKRQAAQQLAE